VVKELNDRELFDRVALAHEHFDDEWIEDVADVIRGVARPSAPTLPRPPPIR
jgi:hypothetical protein